MIYMPAKSKFFRYQMQLTERETAIFKISSPQLETSEHSTMEILVKEMR